MPGAVSARSKGRKGLYDGCGMLIGLDQRGGGGFCFGIIGSREGLYDMRVMIAGGAV